MEFCGSVERSNFFSEDMFFTCQALPMPFTPELSLQADGAKQLTIADRLKPIRSISCRIRMESGFQKLQKLFQLGLIATGVCVRKLQSPCHVSWWSWFFAVGLFDLGIPKNSTLITFIPGIHWDFRWRPFWRTETTETTEMCQMSVVAVAPRCPGHGAHFPSDVSNPGPGLHQGLFASRSVGLSRNGSQNVIWEVLKYPYSFDTARGVSETALFGPFFYTIQ